MHYRHDSTLPTRYLYKYIKEDLEKKMVFIGGPRQVGKTTLSLQFIKKYQDKHPAYLNWDLDEHRKKIRNLEWPEKEPLIVFDEIHKFKNWRSFVKGIYDTLKNTHAFLVTGSARLDMFRKGGDSLLGRYHYYRLHPYSLAELGNTEELPHRVGPPLSIKNLDNLYYCFLASPYGEPKIRAVKKEQKLYLWDWSQIEEPGIRFENMMACHLLKYCHFHEDVYGEKMELRFLRDTDKREIDFVILKNKKPIFAVECKLKSESLNPHMHYFLERTKIPLFFQVHMTGKARSISDNIKILSMNEFCEKVKLV